MYIYTCISAYHIQPTSLLKRLQVLFTLFKLIFCNELFPFPFTAYNLSNHRALYTKQVAYHTPPRFPIHVIESIREGASLLFQQLGLRDFARIDGWFLPNSVHISSFSESNFGKTKFGTIVFTDINLVR